MTTNSINRSDLVQLLIVKYNINPRLAESLVKVVLEQMTDALSQGKRIEIRGFGSFERRYYPPKVTHNPKTGEKLTTEGSYSIHFKPGKQLKENVNH